MQEKAAVGAGLYIEDSPNNVTRLRAENLATTVFTNSTNEHLPPGVPIHGLKLRSWS